MLLNYLFPMRCIRCRSITENKLGLCAKCFNDITFIADPACRICSRPFEISIGLEELCNSCQSEVPIYDIATSSIKFDKNSKKIIHDFKYNDQTNIASYFARLLLASKSDLMEGIDMIAPVPMHPLKRLYRQYNPPEILAKTIHKALGSDDIILLPNLLKKIKHTGTQTDLTKAERQENLRGSIKINKKMSSLHGKTILLVDDVHTTGATANYCSMLLKRHQAKKVIFYSIART